MVVFIHRSEYPGKCTTLKRHSKMGIEVTKDQLGLKLCAERGVIVSLAGLLYGTEFGFPSGVQVWPV